VMLSVRPNGSISVSTKRAALMQGGNDKSLLNIFKFNTAGKIIYGSNAISTPVPQMFVQQVGSNNPPTQFCQSSFAPRWPAWSPNGKYVAYVTTDVIVSNPPGYLETVRIVDLDCNTVAGYYQWDVGRSLFNYPE